MDSELKQELERRIPDSQIPPLPLDSIRKRGGRLRWRRRAAIAGSGFLAVAALTIGSLMLIDNDLQGPGRARPISLQQRKTKQRRLILFCPFTRIVCGQVIARNFEWTLLGGPGVLSGQSNGKRVQVG